jgi:hypothetical protein
MTDQRSSLEGEVVDNIHGATLEQAFSLHARNDLRLRVAGRNVQPRGLRRKRKWRRNRAEKFLCGEPGTLPQNRVLAPCFHAELEVLGCR